MMTLEMARKILRNGGPFVDRMEAVGVAANDAWSSVDDILPGLEHPGAVAEQAAFALYRRTVRPIPADASQLSKDPEEWRRWLSENSMIPADDREVAEDLALSPRQYLRLRHQALEVGYSDARARALPYTDRELIRHYLTRDLSIRDRVIVSLYYNDKMTMAEIAAVLGISEARVCQRLAEIVEQLRARFSGPNDGSASCG